MRKLIITLMMLSFGSIAAFADGDGNNDSSSTTITSPTIVIHRPAYIPGGPRTAVPIECSYNSMLSAVLVNFLTDLGEVDIDVHNISTGTFVSGAWDSSNGVAIITLSGESGSYMISIMAESGEEFIGTFEL
ncbi:MAG: hypothetical protein IJZ70_01010 [Bacteroidales bacterium]|nr:hypothetical protein [Bacteroidales bacterium]